MLKNTVQAVAAVLLCMVFVVISGCGSSPGEDKTDAGTDGARQGQGPVFEKKVERLPPGIQWLTNDSDPVYASPEAEKGGVFNMAILAFPMTFRTVGPDSNSSFRSAILGNQLSLINIHPNTDNILPELATHWAFAPDKKTMYFKLDPDARWSDGVPVTAWDYVYTLAFMRSEHIIAPWYNDYYTKEIEAVTVYDDHTIGVTSTKAVPDLHLKVGISPTPRHFYGTLDASFVAGYNWRIAPNTGAYQISDFEKGKYVRFTRKKDWWARDKKYFKHRFNADHVVFEVIRDFNLQWEHFKKGRLDVFGLTLPKFWHKKSDHPLFHNGLIHRIWFFNDQERSAMGMWLNQDKPIFKDIRVRLAFHHAMDVEKVIQKVLRNDYFRLAQATFGYGRYTDYSIRPRTYDIARVESLMTEAGWQRGPDGVWAKAGQRYSVNVTYSYEAHMPRLVVLKEQALKAGIELNLERLDPSASYKKVMEKKHDVGWLAWSTGMRPSFWQHWHSDNAHKPQTNNITNTDLARMDSLIDRYRASLDEQERIDLAWQIQALVHEQAAFVPTFMVPYVRLGYWRWMRLPDFHGTRRSDDLFDPFSTMTGGLFWIDGKLRSETREAMKKGRSFAPVTIRDERYKK